MNRAMSRKYGASRMTGLEMAILILALFSGCQKQREVLEASGTVEVREADLSSRIGSRIVKLNTDEGAAVKKGDVLAQLDDRIVAAQKEAAEAFFTQAQTNFERSANLFDSKSITREQFDQAKTQYLKARSDLAQARVMLEEATLTAPWNGVILKKNAETGETLSPNTPVFTLGDLSTAKVTIYVPLPDLGRIKLNQRARVQVDSFRNRWFDGTITRIAGEAEFTPKNVQTRDERIKEVFAVEISVPNPGSELKPGMPADVEISYRQ